MSRQALSKDDGILFPPKITCFAINYLTHRLLLCDKERLRIYDLERNTIVNETNYAEKFKLDYESKVKIKAADAIILHNVWITLLNKKSFVFFNDELSHSRVYQVEPNPVASLTALTRNFEFITLRADRKLLKFWHFEPVDKNEIERSNAEAAAKEEKSRALRLEKLAKKTFRARQIELQYDEFKNKMLSTQEQDKAKLAAKNVFPLEFTLFSKRQIPSLNSKVMMQVSFNDELGILAVSFDNMELAIYNLFSCELLYMIETLKPQQNPSDNFGLVNLTIDQEFLYYCDDRKFYRYDLVTNEEFSMPLPNIGRVVSIHAEKSNQNGGVYLMTSDDMLYCLSLAKRKEIRGSC